MPDPVPAILLAKLALDRRFQGPEHGGEILTDAVRSCLEAMYFAGGRVIVVDALHEKAARFYAYFGFKVFADMPLRLFAKPRVLANS